MAVGDPHQAIYGWRGASSSNLADFVTGFGESIATYSLSTSWRNGARILDAANTIAAPLRELPGPEVETLKPSPKASDHALEVVYPETLAEEAEQVASWLADRLGESNPPPSAAIIVRARAHQGVFVDALSQRGVPVHVLGIGGLLDDPAIADIVCTLRVTRSHLSGIGTDSTARRSQVASSVLLISTRSPEQSAGFRAGISTVLLSPKMSRRVSRTRCPLTTLRGCLMRCGSWLRLRRTTPSGGTIPPKHPLACGMPGRPLELSRECRWVTWTRW
jgi:hypothetical protein